MLLWAEADAASGGEEDVQVWADFDANAKAEGVFIENGALVPAATEARLVRTSLGGVDLADAVQRHPFTQGARQIEAFYLMECKDLDEAIVWANRLPKYGYVEVRELLVY
jgi:hypothetical protein